MTADVHFKDAWRILCWRAPLHRDASLSARAIVGIFLGLISIQVLAQLLGCDSRVPPSMDGFNAIVAVNGAAAAIVVFFAKVGRTRSLLRNLVLFYAATTIVNVVLAAILSWAIEIAIVWRKLGPQDLGTYALGIAVVLAAIVTGWMIVAAQCVFGLASHVGRPAVRSCCFVVSLLLVSACLPQKAAFDSMAIGRGHNDLWYVAYAIHGVADRWTSAQKAYDEDDRNEAAAIDLEARQARLLELGVSSMAPRDPAKANVFVLGIAGYASQDVFARETSHSLQILASRFDTAHRSFQLVNDPTTTDRYPLASIQNIDAALRAIGERMDREKDVLILTMTSHGSQRGFALSFGDVIWRSLSPAVLKKMLDEAGIKNRVLIVAACYSGVFVPAFADENTMIMTAASSTRTSFGCANGREWTYFGDAFFAHGLKAQTTLAAAFDDARQTIDQWETAEHLTPSDPQVWIGRDIARRFPHLIGDLPSAAGTRPAQQQKPDERYAGKDAG